MQHIIEGFLNFQKEIFPQRKELFRSLASSQNPKALFISCSDSRLVPELVTQQEPGQLFVIRNAGNIVPSFGPEPGGVSATIEYAVVALGVTDIVICGHSNCGAMKAIATCQCLEPMPAVSHWLRYADAAKAVVEKKTWASETDKVNGMVQENVIAQLNNIKTHPSVCATIPCACMAGSTTSNPAIFRRWIKIRNPLFRCRKIRTSFSNKVFPGHGGPANPHHATQILPKWAPLCRQRKASD